MSAKINLATINFNICGSVVQVLDIIHPEYDEERIIDELGSGTILTTTWFDTEDKHKPAISLHDGTIIAYLLSQEIDGEYSDFE